MSNVDSKVDAILNQGHQAFEADLQAGKTDAAREDIREMGHKVHNVIDSLPKDEYQKQFDKAKEVGKGDKEELKEVTSGSTQDFSFAS